METPPPAERRRAGPCPFCANWEVVFTADGFDSKGARLCELWFCRACGKYFPWDVAVAPPVPRTADSDRRAGEDRREHSRFRVQFVVEVLFVGAKDTSPRVATVLDASRGGVCFLYPEAIAAGVEGNLRLSLPSGFAPFSVHARVVRATPTPGGSHVIAVEFVRVDPKHRATLERYIAGAPPAE